ncbi:rfaE bifunctional protein, domain II [Verrucomicrobium sp. GAS474]|uniref:adenylyltransferase/cytidyltransferase family protein n=1 Tax=Verrucomicrobium sp. GAS474 TaxID=1882831 RepID=UPI000879C091|nr:adenylyltransferase/cytidyltransferase family protein [Verrucomicrobium sp. GAS474]SDT94706.1 rfaE bifunctional protein, domain II [Verrucomicrobium sp. GAS474]
MTSTQAKILPYETASDAFDALRLQGKRIVQCHGTFDLIHPGHIYHLEEARELGDILVVTVTAEHFVNKGPGRPFFNDLLRGKSLAALACVDYVVLIPHPTALKAIECVKPAIYCKGVEYANPDNDVTGNIHEDLRTVEAYGGEVRYLGSIVFSSTKLINAHFAPVPQGVREYCAGLAKEFSPDRFREIVDSFSRLKVLIVGDVIYDRYSYVKVQGLTSKNRILSSRLLSEETQTGGALAVYRHIRQFTEKVDLLSLVGTEPWINANLALYVDKANDRLIRTPSFQTIVKQRFVETAGEGKELNKLFSVNFIDADPPQAKVQEEILRSLEAIIGDYDLVVVTDFGHGLMQDEMRRLVEAKAPYLALNCQTNSNNHGFNIISNQYRRADCFSLDDQELMLSVARKHVNHSVEIKALLARFDSAQAWLTRGGVETIGVAKDRSPCTLLPLESRIVDTVGAGDAFFAVAALGAKLELPIAFTTFLGQLAGAQAVRIVGNTEPISKQGLLKSGMSLLNL